MKNKKTIFEYNFRTFSDLKHVLNSIYKEFKENINEKLYYKIIITKRGKKRTITSNGLYWIFNTFIANNDWQFADKDQVNYIFRCKFLKKPEEEIPYDLITGKSMKMFNDAVNCNFNNRLLYDIDKFTYSSKNLDSIQFNELLKKIAQFASSELGLTLIFPDEPEWDKFFSEYIINRKLIH